MVMNNIIGHEWYRAVILMTIARAQGNINCYI